MHRLATGASIAVLLAALAVAQPARSAGAATVANSNKIIAISFCASDAKMGVQGIGPYAFTMSNSSLTSGAVLAEWAWSKKNWRNAYILLDTTIEYDKAICGGFETRWA